MSNICSSFTDPLFTMIIVDISTATRQTDPDCTSTTTGDHILKKLILIYRNFHAKCTHSNDDDDDKIEIAQTFRFSLCVCATSHIYDIATSSLDTQRVEHMGGYHGGKRHNMNNIVSSKHKCSTVCFPKSHVVIYSYVCAAFCALIRCSTRSNIFKWNTSETDRQRDKSAKQNAKMRR